MNNELAQLLREAASIHEQIAEYSNDRGNNSDAKYHFGRRDSCRAAAAELERAEPVAWLVTGGTVFRDRAFISEAGASNSVTDRGDGATIAALYRHPPASAVPDGFREGAESLKSELLAASKAMLHPMIEGVFAAWELNNAAPLAPQSSDAEDAARLKERLEAAAEVLEHIAEYWNRDQNETAMLDALCHITDAAKVAADAARGGE